MMNPGSLKVTTPSDREIAMTREFDAPRRLVFEALIQPDLIRRWLTGPPGWSMTVCEFDPTVGGTYRYVWRKADGTEMGMGGVVREVVRPVRVVVTEQFDEAWYEGEALTTTRLEERRGRTTLTLVVQYDSKEVRDAVLQSPMEEGVGYSYAQLAELLAGMKDAEGDAPA